MSPREYQEPWQKAPEPKAEKKDYVPPVGPGSKSLPPTGDFRDIDPSLVRDITANKLGKTAIG